MNNKAYLLIAHGSQIQKANDEFVDLAKKVGEHLDDHLVKACFLECAHPTIDEALEFLKNKNVKHIKIFPYFLSSGKHTQIHIPKIVDQFKNKNPDVTIELLDILGLNNEIIKLIVNAAK